MRRRGVHSGDRGDDNIPEFGPGSQIWNLYSSSARGCIPMQSWSLTLFLNMFPFSRCRPDISEAFCKANNLNGIIRSHQFIKEGFKANPIARGMGSGSLTLPR